MRYHCLKRFAIGALFAIGLAGPTAKAADFDWSTRPWSGPSFFPLAVWLQDPINAERYRKAGFNTYVGLWKGPTETQLAALKKAGLHVVCAQNETGLRNLDDRNIIAWMHGDEPDNAQDLPGGKGYGPPIAPGKIIEDYHRIRAADPSRPVVLNLGQGVAWDGWYGRGVRSNHPEDYPDYVKGCDIASFDIYPANHDRKEIAGKLWYVADGVRRLIDWTGKSRLVWNCVECTAIADPKRKPTPQHVRCEAWMSIIHGSRGLIYFVHQFEPVFREAALLDDAEMLAAVTTLNRQITQLAPVLNNPTISDVTTVHSKNPDVPMAIMTKRAAGSTYIFAVPMRNGNTTATFSVRRLAPDARVEVIGEERTIPINGGIFADHFDPWDVHLYRVSSP